MDKISGDNLRQTWLNFFKNKGHRILESVSLVPENDPSLLWINAGVSTLKPFFTGKKIPPCRRLVNSQRCIRTNDIENVGVTSRHLTFFEMLGNFSIGDYFKKEAITFAYEFIFQCLKLPKEKIYITVYEGDPEAAQIWKKCGINDDHIILGNRDRNFWDLGLGPCGPCTEIYYDRGLKYDPQKIGIKLLKDDIENDRYIEIWNIVFSQFNNDGQGNYTDLVSKNIDTGVGFERLLSILQDVPTNFDTDLFEPIIKTIEQFITARYVIDDYFVNDSQKHKVQQYFRILADHFRSATFAIADGVLPTNKDRGYILRKLIRRAVVFAQKLQLDLLAALVKMIDVIVAKYQSFYPFLVSKKDLVVKVFTDEITSFQHVLRNGLKRLNEKILTKAPIDGEFIFHLVETYGIPLEIIKEICNDKQIDLTSSLAQFDKLFAEHRILSKSSHNLVKGMVEQNSNLLKLKVPSTFERHANRISSSCVALFDEQFDVVDVLRGSGYAIFATTPFYATAGGQQHDTGIVEHDRVIVGEVDDVFKGPNLQHIHHLKNVSELKVGDSYLLIYDEQKRQGVKRNHTTEHLLQSALKRLFSDEIKQEGAFKSHEKATFDFSFNRKLSNAELNQLEDEILKIIKLNVPVTTTLATLEEAKQMQALAYFEDRYKKFKQDKLRVVQIGKFSTELCGGTHTDFTSEVEDFYVKNYFSHGNGKWRIEIITGHETIQKYFQEVLTKLRTKITEMQSDLSSIDAPFLNNEKRQLLTSLKMIVFPKTVHHLRDFEQQIDDLQKQVKHLLISNQRWVDQKQSSDLDKAIAAQINDQKFVIYETNNLTSQIISNTLKKLTEQHSTVLFVIINLDRTTNFFQYYVACNQAEQRKINCQRMVKTVNAVVDGAGGGKLNFAQGGVSGLEKLTLLKKTFEQEIQKCVS